MVNGGTLQGGGTLGNVTLNSGSIAPGDTGTLGTLSASNLVWNPGGVMNIALGAPGNSAMLALSQSFQKGTSGSGSGYVFNFNALSGFTLSGTYNIVTFASTTFSASDFSTTGLINGYFTISGNTLQFTVQTSFATWESNYFSVSDLSNPAISGANATPLNDAVPNLLKYLYDINPEVPMSATDRASLPSLGTTLTGGTEYLTLTYRQFAALTGITVNAQTSFDLQTWQPIISQQVGTDPNTGDPMMQAEVPITGTKQFLRLNVTSP
jgi:hypothetical protein